MRRMVAVGAAAVVIGGGVTIGAAWAGGSSDSKPARTGPVALSDATRAEQIATSLASPAERRHYRLPAGRLVSAEVCVRDRCVTREFNPAPACPPAAAACVGTALITRQLGRGVTITVELA